MANFLVSGASGSATAWQLSNAHECQLEWVVAGPGGSVTVIADFGRVEAPILLSAASL
jgi:hypothetical protein